MKNKIVILFIAVLAAAGCTKEAVQMTGSVPEKTVPVKIYVPVDGVTKVTDVSGETSLKSIQLFVFDESGKLNYITGRLTDVGVPATVECSVGRKTVVAVANAPLLTGVYTLDGLGQTVVQLSQNSPDMLTMYGEVETEITEAGGSVSVPVSRLVARISIGKITNRFESDYIKTQRVELDEIYLINVVGETCFRPGHVTSVWYNKGSYTSESQLPELLWSGDIGAYRIDYDQSYETPHYFYCFPNQALEETETEENPCTRLVVRISVEGNRYYYPISIENIERNHTYHISELIITRLGSSDPDSPIKTGTAEFTLEVRDWEEGFNESVTI